MQTSSLRHAADRRDSYRLPLAPGEASITTSDGRNISMLDVSASGVSIALPRDAIGRLEARSATITLGTTSFSGSLDLVRLEGDEQRICVGGRFRSLPLEGQRALSSFLIRGFLNRTRLLNRLRDEGTPTLVWNDHARVDALLRLHALNRVPLRFYDGNDSPSHFLKLRAIVTENHYRWLAFEQLDARYQRPPVDSEHTIVLLSSGSIYHFQSTVLAWDHDLVRLSVPDAIRQTGFRNSLRSRIERGSASLHLADQPRAWIEDVGARGLSFEVARATCTMAPGQHIHE